MSTIPPGVRCDRCRTATAELNLGTEKVAHDWVKLECKYRNTSRTIDVCPGCIQEVKAAGGLDLRPLTE
jgi:hypothetical protein